MAERSAGAASMAVHQLHGGAQVRQAQKLRRQREDIPVEGMNRSPSNERQADAVMDAKQFQDLF